MSVFQACMYVHHMYAWYPRSEKGICSPGMELQMVVSCHVGRPGSCQKQPGILNCCTISPPLVLDFFNLLKSNTYGLDQNLPRTQISDFNFIYLVLWVFCLDGYTVHVCLVYSESLKKKKKGRRINPPGTEVTDAVSHHWVLGPKHRSSVSTARALDHWAITPVLYYTFLTAYKFHFADQKTYQFKNLIDSSKIIYWW